MSHFSFIDLFAGIGGFHMAASKAGGKCLGYSEINKDAIQTYCKNYGMTEKDNLGSVVDINFIPEHDLLTAGVPCQSWSIAGHKLGFDDDRGQLWNDTIYLLQKFKPKVFIFENVKGLIDPRNKEAFEYIMMRIKEAGYYADYYILNSNDYGVPQNRERVYIIGFKKKCHNDLFEPPIENTFKPFLSEVLEMDVELYERAEEGEDKKSMSLSSSNGYNDYFMFNDLRGGESTIHSWEIIKTSKKQKSICELILKNRRKKKYGVLDGNPLSVSHLIELDSEIQMKDIKILLDLDILKEIEYVFILKNILSLSELSEEEGIVVNLISKDENNLGKIKLSTEVRRRKMKVIKVLNGLIKKEVIECSEVRYDFKNTKISTGLFGVNRIFLPSSKTFSTLVASDTNDFISEIDVKRSATFKQDFLKEVYEKGLYRKLSKEESCTVQGFPKDYKLPEKRNRWMKLLGNSVSVPVIDKIMNSIKKTGVFIGDYG